MLGCTDSVAQNFRPSATLRAECAYSGGCVRGAGGEDITPRGFCHDESPPPPPALPPPPPAGGRRLGHASTPSASALAAYCADTPGWSSSSDNTCAEYAALRWCAAGTYGATWQHTAWGGFELWARPGSTGAGEACCQCGGGHPQP